MVKLLIYYIFLCYTLQNTFTNAFPYYCKDDSDCANIKDAKCSPFEMCECPTGKVISSDGKSCLTVASGAGFSCVDDVQCGTFIFGPSECNKDGLCACSSGYRLRDNKCQLARRLGESCTTDLDCYDDIDMNAMKCKNKVCTCNDDYYPRAGIDCRPSAKDDGKCFFDIDCQNNNEMCEMMYGPPGKCVTKPKDKPEDNPEEKTEEKPKEKYIHVKMDAKQNYSKVTGVGKSCQNDEECDENSFCSKLNNQCSCKESYTFNKKYNTCVKAIGSDCLSDSNCVKNAECNADKKCQCEKYYINGVFNEKCHKPAKGYQHSCTSNLNCYSFGKNAICVNNKCVCDSTSVFEEDFHICRPRETGIINKCLHDLDCGYKAHSHCDVSVSVCVCNENFTGRDETCYPDLGSVCNDASECTIDNSDCITQKCTCKKGFVQSAARECIPGATDIESECEKDVQCQQLLGEGGQCINNSCNCTSGYLLKDTTCIKIIPFAGYCRSLLDCKRGIETENFMSCRNNRCACAMGYKQIGDEENWTCTKDGGNTSAIVKYNLFYVALLIALLSFMY